MADLLCYKCNKIDNPTEYTIYPIIDDKYLYIQFINFVPESGTLLYVMYLNCCYFNLCNDIIFNYLIYTCVVCLNSKYTLYSNLLFYENSNINTMYTAVRGECDSVIFKYNNYVYVLILSCDCGCKFKTCLDRFGNIIKIYDCDIVSVHIKFNKTTPNVTCKHTIEDKIAFINKYIKMNFYFLLALLWNCVIIKQIPKI